MSFWGDVYVLRRQGLIPRQWSRADIHQFLGGKYKLNTINSLPSNQSMSKDGSAKGNYVPRGVVPKAWRIGFGIFELIEDSGNNLGIQNAGMEEVSSYCSKYNMGLDGKESPRPSATCFKISDQSKWLQMQLTAEEHDKIGQLKKTEDKAVAIVIKYLKDIHGEQNIEIGYIKGADLRVTFRNKDREEEIIEVKGTASRSVSWSQLKVSSQQSHDNLAKGIPLYRVVDADSKTPRIIILKYGRDFKMVPEPRWAVKPNRR